MVTLGYLLILLACYGIHYYYAYQKRHTIQKKDLQEDIANGAEDEPHPVRDLTASEEDSLQGNFNSTHKYYHAVWIIIIIALYIQFIFAIALAHLPLVVEFIFTSIIIIICMIVLHEYFTSKLEKIYFDLQSPVFQVTGEVIKEKQESKYGTYYYITVRKVKFSGDNCPYLSEIFDSILDEEILSIQYSLQTKTVWAILKQNGENILATAKALP